MLKASQTDEELMVLYLEGSEEAFKQLYDRHSRKIFGYLRARTNSVEEATDLFQEVFVKVHRSKHLYDRNLPVLPWIFSVTYSVLIDGKRSRSRKKEVFDFDFEQMPAAEKLAGGSGDMNQLIQQLPQNQSSALQMRYLDEKTFEEIAASLKTSPINVRQIISRGIKNLKRIVNEGEKS